MSDSNLSALSRLSFSRRSALAGLTGLGAVALALTAALLGRRGFTGVDGAPRPPTRSDCSGPPHASA